MNFNETYKDNIGDQLTLRMAQALNDHKLTTKEASYAASYILDNLDKITTHLELLEFLTKLSQKWPVFTTVLTSEKGRELEEKKEEKVSEVTKLIKEKKIDEAIKQAENAAKEEKAVKN